MINPSQMALDLARYERELFADSFRRVLAGSTSLKNLAAVAAIYIGLTSVRTWLHSKEDNPENSLKSGRDSPCGRDEPYREFVNLIDSAVNSVELGAVMHALNIPFPDLDTHIEQMHLYVKMYVRSMYDNLRESGSVDEAADYLQLSNEQIICALCEIRSV